MIKNKASKAIILQNKSFLLQLRDRKTKSYPDQWSFFGGNIEINESPWEALKRELKEEINWKPTEGIFLYSWLNPEDKCLIYFYKIFFEESEKDLSLNEGQQMKWLTLNQIKNLKKVNSHVLQHIKNSL